MNLRMRESKSRALPLGDTPTTFQINGAGDKFRTCYLQSHNLALYRLSYARHFGAPGEIRTPDTRLRRPLLYPAELQARDIAFLNTLERVMGIGPTQPAWKASVLPLNYTRIVRKNLRTSGLYDSMLRNYIKSKFYCQLILKHF